ncbi:MAG: SDR family oxidoreductase [Ilumatobacter sp.]|uniref:SDR family oxidoreductase n=1 Tax=Ilumatobacter sp. TaxID=1967498 RepID=UPI002639375D|nr:SDR family oxidoreductase [Ilumatobacter sp.]MDJ0769628.1 SDR family oxidoreductase [Ilumatobacter sp.]
MKVGVIGATGYVGGRLVPYLLAAGHEVRCVVRTPSRLDRVAWRSEVDVVAADVTDEESLVPAFEGLDAVFYLVHAMGLSHDFEQTDRLGAENTARAAERAGLSRLIYLGGLGDDTGKRLSEHLASRHEVGRILAAGPVPVTELRAAVIIGSGSASFEMLRHLDEVLPVMVCPRWVTRTRCQPIGISDVLHYLVAVLDAPGSVGRVLEIGGPDVLTYKDMMDAYADAAGLRRRIVIPVPLLTPRLSSHWNSLVTPLPYGLARPLVDSLINDVVVRPDHDIRTIIAHEPLTLEAAIRRALTRVQDLQVWTSWMDSNASVGPASPRPHDPDWAGGTVLEDVQTVDTDASPEAVFAAVQGVGGERGWYVGKPLWALRGWIDKLVGGVGMRRGRRHPDELRVGDALDFFRVEAFEPPHLLRLRAEMKVPGAAWLEWRVSTDDATGRTVLRQLARFHPRGIAGRLYWWVLLPPHAVIWRQLARRLVGAAQASSSNPRHEPSRVS